MSTETKPRTYSIFSYADAYFWTRCPALKQEIGKAIGLEYVNTDTQMGNITSRLRDLGHADLEKQLKQYLTK